MPNHMRRPSIWKAGEEVPIEIVGRVMLFGTWKMLATSNFLYYSVSPLSILKAKVLETNLMVPKSRDIAATMVCIRKEPSKLEGPTRVVERKFTFEASGATMNTICLSPSTF